MKNSPIRLNKFIADSGVASRRKADELIESGQVQVNGKKVYELGVKVDPEVDRVKVKGKPLRPEQEKVYLMFNKPVSVVTSLNDPTGRPSIADYLRRFPLRIFPVGRLDWDSEGMLLLTNDGDFSQKVSHPKFAIPKTYLVKVDGQPAPAQLQKLLKGVSIVGGRVKANHVEKIERGKEKHAWVKIVISEGKNRQIRQMMAKIGFDVLKLQRVAIGQLRMGKLDRGQFKVLSPNDLKKIFQVYVPVEKRTPRQVSTKHAPTQPVFPS